MDTKEPSREQIWTMFDEISPTYDRVNRWMTFGLDQYWRKKALQYIPRHPIKVLDCATGTGDQLFALAKHPEIVQGVGIDLAKNMLALARLKAAKHASFPCSFVEASLLDIPFETHTFDVATLAFGIRNVTDVEKALREIQRVLIPKGRILILETSLPSHPILAKGHRIYLHHILPKIGALLSKKRDAYHYLHKTARTFPHGATFCKILSDAGFVNVSCHPLTFGAVSLYSADTSHD